MKKLIVFVVIGLAASACATVHTPGGGTHRYLMYQVGVVVLVVNNCAPVLDLQRVNGQMVAENLLLGESVPIPLISTPLSGNNRQMALVAKGYSVGRKEYLGSANREFYVNAYEGSQEEVWEVNQLRLTGGRGGCK